MIETEQTKQELDEIEAQNKKMWAEWAETEKEIHKEIMRINNRLLKAIGNQLGKQWVEDISECMEESEADGAMELCRKPRGQYQEDEYTSFKGVWVDQWSVGMEGDSWEGYICIELKKGLWLKSHYSM